MRANLWTNLTALTLVALMSTAAWPTTALGDETPDTRPFAPDTGTFYVHQAKNLGCGIAAADMAGVPLEGAFLYATNVAEDTCAKTREDGSNAVTLSPEAGFTVYLVPALDQPLELVSNASINLTVWLWTENIGAVSPAFTLAATGWARHEDRGDIVDPTDIQATPGARVWHRFDLDFGPSPSEFAAGAVTLQIDLGISEEEVRRVGAYRVGLGVVGDQKSSFALPLAEQVDEPGEPPVLDWPPAIEDATVRPGVQHVTAGAQCTTNFVFRDRTSDKLYMGTAAHCVAGVGIGGPSTIRTTGGGTAIQATLAYSSWRSGPGSDFALLEIPKDREQDVHPAVLHFGGPTALADIGNISTGDKVITFGNSGLRPGPQALDWHEGYVTGRSAWYTSVYTVTPAIFGDSGSGIMTADGQAIGAASTIEYAPVPGRNHFGNIPLVIDWLNENGWDLELQTWDLIDPGVLPAPLG